MKAFFIFLVIAFSVSTVLGDTFYTWTDKEGVVHITDRPPCRSEAEEQKVTTTTTKRGREKKDSYWSSYCEIQSAICGKIMEARQMGLPMSKIMDLKTEFDDDYFEIELYELHVKLAYSMPRYSTEEGKRRAIEDFRHEAYLRCMRANVKSKKPLP